MSGFIKELKRRKVIRMANRKRMNEDRNVAPSLTIHTFVLMWVLRRKESEITQAGKTGVRSPMQTYSI